MLCISDICSGAEGMTLGCVSLSRHTSQFLLDHAKLMQEFAHRFAFGCIGCGQIKGVACTADRCGTKFQAANIEDIERDFIAFVDFTEQVLNRDFGIFKDNLTR